MTGAFRLDACRAGDLDAALWELGRAWLERRDDGLLLFVDADAGLVTELFARVGWRATPAAGASIDAALLPAVAGDLRRRDAPGVIDRVCVRAVAIGEATRRLRRRFAPLGRPRYQAASVASVLHGRTRFVAWRRVIWADRRTLRRAQLRDVRPLVFDRSAAERGPERVAVVGAGEIARWADAD